jgi:hypothetical protein
MCVFCAELNEGPKKENGGDRHNRLVTTDVYVDVLAKADYAVYLRWATYNSQLQNNTDTCHKVKISSEHLQKITIVGDNHYPTSIIIIIIIEQVSPLPPSTANPVLFQICP